MIVFINTTQFSSSFTNGSVKVWVRTIGSIKSESVEYFNSPLTHSLTHLHCQVLQAVFKCSNASVRLQSITGFCTSYQWNTFSLSRVLPGVIRWHRKVFPGVRGVSGCELVGVASERVRCCCFLILHSEIQKRERLMNERKIDFFKSSLV